MSWTLQRIFSRFAKLYGVFGLVGAPWIVSLTAQAVFAADLTTIQQRGYLVVGVKDTVRPLGFRNSTGEWVGLEIEIAQRLGQEIFGRSDAVRLKAVLNPDRIPAVLEDRVDLVVARVTQTRSRERLVSLSLPYYLDGTGFVTNRATLQRFKDLANQPIAVLKGSSTIAVVRYWLPTAKLVGVDSYEAGRQLMERGGAIAFAGDISVLSGWVQEFPGYHRLDTTLSVEPLCVVMPKGLQYDSLRRQVNAAIARWQQEGWLQERALYWGLPWANLKKESRSTGTTPE